MESTSESRVRESVIDSAIRSDSSVGCRLDAPHRVGSSGLSRGETEGRARGVWGVGSSTGCVAHSSELTTTCLKQRR